MIAKALEVRDEGTFIPILAVDMNPSGPGFKFQKYLLRRCGYPTDGRPNIIVTRLSGNGQATNDPYGWSDGSHTIPIAHNYIIDHWDELKDGDVVDVEFIRGLTATPKLSERLTARGDPL